MSDVDRINRLNRSINFIYSTTSPSDGEDDVPNYGYIALLISCVMSFDEKARYLAGENISDIISH
jgi:hypothetical protein